MISWTNIAFIASFLLLIMLVIYGYRHKCSSKDVANSVPQIMDFQLFVILTIVGVLLISIYSGLSDLFYGFDVSSEISHILSTYRKGSFTFTISAYSNLLSLVVFIPSYVSVSNISIILFYKLVYPIIILIHVIYFYLFCKKMLNNCRKYFYLLIPLSISTYLFFYGFASSLKYGTTYIIFLALVSIIIKRNNEGMFHSKRDLLVSSLLVSSLIMMYYSIGILSDLFLSVSATYIILEVVRQRNNLRKDVKQYFTYVTVFAIIFSFVYWFYYAYGTQQHLIDSLKRLLYGTSERIETKSSLVYSHMSNFLPQLGFYIKTLSLLSVLGMSFLGMIYGCGKAHKCIFLRSAFISLILSLLPIGFILGIYYTLGFYWPLIIISAILFADKVILKARNTLIRKMLLAGLVIVVILNMLSQSMIINTLFGMKGGEVAERLIFNSEQPLSITLTEFLSIKSMYTLIRNNSLILIDVFAESRFYQVISLSKEKKTINMINIVDKSKLYDKIFIYIDKINLEEGYFYEPIGGYGSPIPLARVMNLDEDSIVYNSYDSLLLLRRR